MHTIAFVTPWYGENVPGGAEAQTRQTAVHLHAAGIPVEILTTCARDLYSDWSHNHHRPGVELVQGIPVRRFPVQPRDKAAFDAVNWRLIHKLPITAEQERTFLTEMIKAPALYDYMRQQQERYLFIFIPYMFATTVYGATIAPERSLMIPCLHDEPYLRLAGYREPLQQVKGLLFFTEAEAKLADTFFPDHNGQIRQVVGGGIDTDVEASAARFWQQFGGQMGEKRPFILSAGRREISKNTPLLLDYWARYQQENGRSVNLVLIGSGNIAVPPTAQSSVIDLGYVSEQARWDAFAAATVFCQPSVHESFSRVIMESWLTETPVLVHGHCTVMKEHCQRANGGLYFTNYDEFAATLDYLLVERETAVTLGQQGRCYVLAHFQWPHIIATFRRIFAQLEEDMGRRFT